MKNLPIGHDGSKGPGSRIGACCCAGLLALALLPAFWPDTAAAHTCDDPFSTADLHVATVPDPPADPDANIPQNRPGNPKPGQFAYGDEHDCAGTATFTIEHLDIDGGVGRFETVVVAAHAEVDDGERMEGAWGDGTRFVERGNWATYFTYIGGFVCGPCPQEVCENAPVCSPQDPYQCTSGAPHRVNQCHHAKSFWEQSPSCASCCDRTTCLDP